MTNLRERIGDYAFSVEDRLNRHNFIRNTYLVGAGIVAVAAIGIKLGIKKIASGLEKATKSE